MAFAVTASNVRQLRNWHQRNRNGDRAHPLQEEPRYHGDALLTAEQAATVVESLGSPRTAAWPGQRPSRE
jgi:hypothetical protein